MQVLLVAAYVHAVVSGHIGPRVYGDMAAQCNPVTDWDRTGVFPDGVTQGRVRIVWGQPLSCLSAGPVLRDPLLGRMI